MPAAEIITAAERFRLTATPAQNTALALDREHVEGIASAFQLLMDRIEAARPHLCSDQARRMARDLETMLADVRHDASLTYVMSLCNGKD